MTNLEKYKNAFVEGLGIPAEKAVDGLEYQAIPNGILLVIWGLLRALKKPLTS